MQEVQIKAPKHEFTLLCDDIRQEMGRRPRSWAFTTTTSWCPKSLRPCQGLLLQQILAHGRPVQVQLLGREPQWRAQGHHPRSDVQIPEERQGRHLQCHRQPFEVGAEGVFEVIIASQGAEPLLNTSTSSPSATPSASRPSTRRHGRSQKAGAATNPHSLRTYAR